MKIIVGSGGHQVPGWWSTEIDEVDICKPLPVGDASVEAIFASHVVEHVASPDAMRFFLECHRALVAGGWLRISIPVIGWWLDPSHVRALAIDHGHLCTYNEELLRTLLWAAGFSQIRRVDFDHELEHHWKTIGRELDNLESCRIIATK